jgi:8-oxo-dGTP pyrophosphatase MutT (NUDIX family)
MAACARPPDGAAAVTGHWAALAAVALRDGAARVPFTIAGRPVGSVARSHLPALADWPKALTTGAAGVDLVVDTDRRDPTLAHINGTLCRRGLIHGWRDETFPLPDLGDGTVLARGERAASRFWGSLTTGAHATGYVTDDQGRPTHLWLARRAQHKPTDPGMWDNLVGGGVADGQTPREALIREGWEEAGLDAALMQQAQVGRVLRLHRDVAQGLQLEDLHGFDLRMPPEVRPQCIDGEVECFERMPVQVALALAASPQMAVDAALITLDFSLRHSLLPPTEHRQLAAALRPLIRAA